MQIFCLSEWPFYSRAILVIGLNCIDREETLKKLSCGVRNLSSLTFFLSLREVQYYMKSHTIWELHPWIIFLVSFHLLIIWALTTKITLQSRTSEWEGSTRTDCIQCAHKPLAINCHSLMLWNHFVDRCSRLYIVVGMCILCTVL